jgi:CYTH domain-containing protein
MSDDARKPQTEVERKFLVDAPPDKRLLETPALIEQGYVAAGSDGTEVRLRRKGDRFYQTIKQGQGLSRVQIEIELSPEQFESMWPHTEGRRVTKYRHEIPLGPHVIELDVFHGPLEGLIIAEVEFESVEQARVFEPPEWFGEEVTEDARFQNRNLALNGRPGRRARG